MRGMIERGILRGMGLRKQALVATTTIAAALAVLGAPAPAVAGLQHEFSVFSDCPVNTPGVQACIVSTVTSGEFKLGSKTVPINKTVTLQGGIRGTELVPAADGNTLSKTPLVVPGGLVGLEVLPPLTEVTATAELAGTVLLNFSPVEVTLPLKAKLDNPLLLNECYIGSNSEPITPHLIEGTTNPPPPNKPITGSEGTPSIGGNGKIVTVNGTSLVDNAFSVPGANGCAGPLALLVDPAVDLQAGLPAAAGTNTAILNGSLADAGSEVVRAEATLPEFGRCEKVEGVKEGKVTVFHGAYVASNCVEEERVHKGKFEWHPGAGAGNKFTGSSGKVTLETKGNANVTCAGSTSAGEYTGTKTVSETVTLTGCVLATAKKEACQSAGAGAGEIVTSSLQGKLGFIVDQVKTEGLVVSVGLDLEHAPSLLTAECGASKQSVAVAGSVIAPITALEKMAPSSTLKYKSTGAAQAPEQFEEGSKDTLSTSFGGGPAAQSGLTATQKITNEEKLEIKAEFE
jgi:hypothetical protein